MPRAFFPHSMADITRAVDGPLGLIVADMPDGSLWVLKRNRKGPGYALTQYVDTARSAQLSSVSFEDRREALNAMADAIHLGERI